MVTNSVFCRKRSPHVSLESKERYINYAAEVVDGEVKYTPSPVVVPALSESSSVIMNAITNKGRVPHRGRTIVDAVDLKDTIDKIG